MTVNLSLLGSTRYLSPLKENDGIKRFSVALSGGLLLYQMSYRILRFGLESNQVPKEVAESNATSR
jgi:hypothetical protein